MIEDGRRCHGLLIDCGTDIRWSMKKAGKSVKDVEAVYISHMHADHAGGLDWLAYSKYFDPDAEKPNLICHNSLVSKLIGQVEGSMTILDGFTANFIVIL